MATLSVAVGLSCIALATPGCDPLHFGDFDGGAGGWDLGCHGTPGPHMTNGFSIIGCGAPVCVIGWGDCNGTGNDGCEVDLTSDVTHCGACDVACSGGRSCSDGSCFGVETVATVAGTPPGFGYPFALGGDSVYVSTDRSIVRIPKSGGDAVTVPSDTLSGLVADADGAYWVEGGGTTDHLLAWPRGEIATSVVAASSPSTPELDFGGAIGTDAKRIFLWGNVFTDGSFTCRAAFAVPKTGGPPTTVVCDPAPPATFEPGGKLAVGNSTIYWLSGTNLMETPLWRGPPDVLATSFASGPIAAAPNAVFGAGASQVARFDTTDGTTTLVWTGSGSVKAMVADDAAAYLVFSNDSSGADEIVRVSGSGGAIVLAGAEAYVGGIAIDDRYVYFSAMGDGGALVRRVTKSP